MSTLHGEFITTVEGITVFVHGENYTWVVSTVPMDDVADDEVQHLEIVYDNLTKAQAIEEFIHDYMRHHELNLDDEKAGDYQSYENFLMNMLDHQAFSRP